MVGVCLRLSRRKAARGRRGRALGGAGPARTPARGHPTSRSASSRAPRTRGLERPPPPPPAASPPPLPGALAAFEVSGGPEWGASRAPLGTPWVRPRGARAERLIGDSGPAPRARPGSGRRAPPTPRRVPPSPPACPPLPPSRGRLHTHLLPSVASAPRSGRIRSRPGVSRAAAGKARATPRRCARTAPGNPQGPSASSCWARPPDQPYPTLTRGLLLDSGTRGKERAPLRDVAGLFSRSRSSGLLGVQMGSDFPRSTSSSARRPSPAPVTQLSWI